MMTHQGRRALNQIRRNHDEYSTKATIQVGPSNCRNFCRSAPTPAILTQLTARTQDGYGRRGGSISSTPWLRRIAPAERHKRLGPAMQSLAAAIHPSATSATGFGGLVATPTAARRDPSPMPMPPKPPTVGWAWAGSD